MCAIKSLLNEASPDHRKRQNMFTVENLLDTGHICLQSMQPPQLPNTPENQRLSKTTFVADLEAFGLPARGPLHEWSPPRGIPSPAA